MQHCDNEGAVWRTPHKKYSIKRISQEIHYLKLLNNKIKNKLNEKR